jgi:hypothetical protein
MKMLIGRAYGKPDEQCAFSLPKIQVWQTNIQALAKLNSGPG